MTREEKAIIYFKDLRKKFCEDYLLGIPQNTVAYKATMAEKEFYDTAIKALEQQPCEDAISRQAAIDALDNHKYSNHFCKEHRIDRSINLGMAHIVINNLPSVTPQQKVEQKPCEFCTDLYKGDTLYQMTSWDGGIGFDYVYAKFCPICGRKLENGEVKKRDKQSD